MDPSSVSWHIVSNLRRPSELAQQIGRRQKTCSILRDICFNTNGATSKQARGHTHTWDASTQYVCLSVRVDLEDVGSKHKI
nr:hypothetical protein BgiMline_024786 [Biomphalaria glabrata]